MITSRADTLHLWGVFSFLPFPALPILFRADVFVAAVMLHLAADWILQNSWMANNKKSIRHPAAWVHGSMHFLAMLLLLSATSAAMVAILHVIIDTRTPLVLWRKLYRQELPDHAAVWQDQAVHVLILYLVCLWKQ